MTKVAFFYVIFENKVMSKIYTIVFSFLLSTQAFAQMSLDPVFASQNDSVTIIYDATKGNGALKDLGPPDVYIHTGVITNLSTGNSDWRYVKGVWGTDDLPRKMTYMGSNIYKIKIYIPTFYGVPGGETIKKIAAVFRNKAGDKVGRNADGTDIYADIFPPGLKISFTKPAEIPGIFETTDNITFEAKASEAAKITFLENGVQLDTQTTTTFTKSLTGRSAGRYMYVVRAQKGSLSASDTLYISINPGVTAEALPAGMVDGANYINDSTLLFSLVAPGKNYAYVIGDFNNWQPLPAYFMKKTPDGNRWWLRVSGLKKGQQYGYQYLVDGLLREADPLSELILDNWNDPFVNKSDFPGLPNYPAGKTTGLVSVIQPGKSAYAWKHDTFTVRNAGQLNIYELHIRDFIAAHAYTVLKDTLPYLKKLGVTAIKLMPVNEFEGNSSWGYNVSYHMALDKYYGNANQLKAFIDECHKQGIAVILDVVFNHVFGQSTLCHLYWNSTLNQPADNNPWLNPVAKHDFNVGYDFNHESQFTQQYMDRTLKYWLQEFKADGFRFDLSKGFTQKNTLGNTTAWGQYDGSRIYLLKRMRDEIRKYDNNAVLILEHFADNSEETELSNEGFMLWGNGNTAYTEVSMGYNYDISWFSNYKNRGWSKPNLVSYMESHDEERMMYKNINFGNASGNYNIKLTPTGLKRCEMATVLFFSVPGPKMVWQFGELGYDVSISTNGRTGEKPIRWNYLTEPNRQSLQQVYSTMMNLRNKYPVFHTTYNNFDLSGRVKKAWLQYFDHYVHVIANTDVISVNTTYDFHDTGKWFEVFSGDSLRVTNKNMPVTLAAGAYRLFTNKRMELQPKAQIPNNTGSVTGSSGIVVFPNPASETLHLIAPEKSMISVRDAAGRIIYVGSADMNGLNIHAGSWPNGVYFIHGQSQSRSWLVKSLIQH
ncbi:MAG: T9SS C-terminal target domain-containing protein [Bacteroidetes bacterium]|nr:T9SS C-terminal target domain-containing protein [Bacteroidota bacterium]